MGTTSASGSPNSHGLNLAHEQRMKSLRDTYRYVRGHKFRGNIQSVSSEHSNIVLLKVLSISQILCLVLFVNLVLKVLKVNGNEKAVSRNSFDNPMVISFF